MTVATLMRPPRFLAPPSARVQRKQLTSADRGPGQVSRRSRDALNTMLSATAPVGGPAIRRASPLHGGSMRHSVQAWLKGPSGPAATAVSSLCGSDPPESQPDAGARQVAVRLRGPPGSQEPRQRERDSELLKRCDEVYRRGASGSHVGQELLVADGQPLAKSSPRACRARGMDARNPEPTGHATDGGCFVNENLAYASDRTPSAEFSSLPSGED